MDRESSLRGALVLLTLIGMAAASTGGCALLIGVDEDYQLVGGGGSTGGTIGGGGITGGTGGITGGTGGITGGTGGTGGLTGGTGGTGGLTGGTGGGEPGGCGPALQVTQLVSGESSPAAIAVDASNVYWTNDLMGARAIRKLSKGTNVASDLVVVEPKKPWALAVAGNYLYWSEERVVTCAMVITDVDNDRIMRVDIGAQLPAEQLHASCGKSQSLVVRGAALYRTRPSANRVQRSNVDGTSLQSIFDGSAMNAAPFGLAVDDVNAYWTDTSMGVVSFCDANQADCTPQVFAQAPGTNTWVADDVATVYWTTTSEVRKLDKASPGGSPMVLGDIGAAGGIALDADAVYVTDTIAGKVLRFCKSDGTKTEIATGQLSPRGIAVDASGVYWVNGGDGSIYRAAP